MGLNDFDDEVTAHSLGNSPYGYSGMRLDDPTKLLSPMYTLATVVVDDSGSVDNFRKLLERLLAEIPKSLLASPRADYVMLRVVRFGSQFKEIHGFIPLDKIKLEDYDGCLGDGGGTYLYGACVNALDATFDYAKQLFDLEYKVNGFCYVITDGEDNMSNRHGITAATVRDSLKRFKKQEVMESMVSILVGVNMDEPSIKQSLDDFSKVAEFNAFLSLDDASEKTLKRVAGFGSQSISLQSQALGTGGPSQAIQSLTI